MRYNLKHGLHILFKMASELVQCRICKSEQLCEVIDLGQQIITSRFPKLGDYTTPSTKIRLAMCFQCNLVQLKDTTPSSELYEHMYGYRSGISNTMRQHLKAYNDEIQTYITLHDNDFVLDIGSNDSTMLQNYSSRLHPGMSHPSIDPLSGSGYGRLRPGPKSCPCRYLPLRGLPA